LAESHPNPEWEGDYPLWGWDRRRIQEAAQQLDAGNFVEAERLYEAMTRLGRISSALRRRAEGLRRFDFHFDWKDGTPDRIQAFGHALEEGWDEHVLSETGRSEVIQRVIFFGFCACRIHKPIIDGQRVTMLEPWTHRTLIWTFVEKAWRGLDDQGQMVTIPREGNDEWVVFSLGGKRPWLKGAGRELARIMAQILQTEDLWDSNNEALGYAQKVLGLPVQLREQSEVQRAWGVVSRLRAGDVWLKPQGYELDLLETKRGDTHQNFKARLDVLATAISIIILYHNLTQETHGGSLAATKSAMDLPREASVTDARILEIGFRQLARLWVKLNFAPAHYVTERPLGYYAPTPKFDTDEPEDENALADTGQKNAQALSQFMDSATKANVDIETIGIDWREQAKRCNLALLIGPEGEESSDSKKNPVKYKDPPPAPPALPPARPSGGAAPQKMGARSREPESEDERSDGDSLPDSPMWTV
jgi:hypothetical protein